MSFPNLSLAATSQSSAGFLIEAAAALKHGIAKILSVNAVGSSEFSLIISCKFANSVLQLASVLVINKFDCK